MAVVRDEVGMNFRDFLFIQPLSEIFIKPLDTFLIVYRADVAV